MYFDNWDSGGQHLIQPLNTALRTDSSKQCGSDLLFGRLNNVFQNECLTEIKILGRLGVQ
jgi:hypothetical protein